MKPLSKELVIFAKAKHMYQGMCDALNKSLSQILLYLEATQSVGKLSLSLFDSFHSINSASFSIHLPLSLTFAFSLSLYFILLLFSVSLSVNRL